MTGREEGFFRALLPPDARILGRRLGVYSLWHEALLEVTGNPLAGFGDGREPGIPDLLAALKICSVRFPDQPEMRPTLGERVLAGYLAARPRRFFRAARAFARWRAGHLVRPDLRRLERVGDGRGARKLTAPPLLSVLTYFLERGMAAETVFGLSPGFAQWLRAGMDEWQGGPGFEEDAAEIADSLPPVLTEDEALAQSIRDLGPGLARRMAEARKRNAERARRKRMTGGE